MKSWFYFAPLIAALNAAALDFQLQTEIEVTSQGVLLDQLFTSTATNLPAISVSTAPAVGRPLSISKEQIREHLRKNLPEGFVLNLIGPDRVRVVRKARLFTETDLRDLITSTLTRESLHGRGELEIRLTRPWSPVNLPDEVITMKALDLPSSGLSSNFILRSEVYAGAQLLGTWQVPVQARIWQDVYVARSAAFRGQLLKDADLVKERRDILTLRDAVSSVPNEEAVELAESVPAGQPLLVRSLKIRPVVRRGKIVEALVQDGSISISVKVEVLEDGVPGQTVRVRNLQSRKEFRGKVQNEQTIVVML